MKPDRNTAERREFLRIYGPAIVLVIVGFTVAFQFIKPAPPSHVVIATGSTAGAYYRFARRYADILAREGVTLEVISTEGSIENLQQLQDGQVDVAFIQGGTPRPVDYKAGFLSLGSLYYEPLWLFHQAGRNLDRITALRGLRVAVGGDGSGTRALVQRLLTLNGLSHDGGERPALRLLPHSGEEAVAALKSGEADAAFFVMSPLSPLIERMLRDPELELASLERVEAYARRERYLSALTLPEGTLDLGANLPRRTIRLLAPTANLVANPDLHPAIIDLLLQAADEVHGQGGWFEASGDFPSASHLEFALSKEARRYYEQGPPFLQRYLPFWAASLVDRLKVMLLPLIVLLLPFAKIMPPLYSWRMRARVYRWYRKLEDIDDALYADAATDQQDHWREELDRLDAEVRRVQVPLSFAGQLYHLRQHIDWVRARLRSTSS